MFALGVVDVWFVLFFFALLYLQVWALVCWFVGLGTLWFVSLERTPCRCFESFVVGLGLWFLGGLWIFGVVGWVGFKFFHGFLLQMALDLFVSGLFDAIFWVGW